MKKGIAISSLLIGIFFLSGCGQSQTNQTQTTQPTKTNLTTQTVQTTTTTSQAPTNSNQNNVMELKSVTTKAGTGERTVKAGDTVSVQYTGKLTDGTKFDSSYDHGGQPFSFTVGQGQVIKGWDQGLIGMKIGEERTLTIPGSLAYGASGIPGVIPPNATLVFDVKMVAIK